MESPGVGGDGGQNPRLLPVPVQEELLQRNGGAVARERVAMIGEISPAELPMELVEDIQARLDLSLHRASQ